MRPRHLLIAGFLSIAAIMPALAEQHIFSLTKDPQTSTTLGATGVCAYVLNKGKKRRGFFITGVSETGFWRMFGLQPGDLVLSIAKTDTVDAESVDKAVHKAVGDDRAIVFVRPEADGTPKVITEKTAIPNPDDQGPGTRTGTPPTQTAINNSPQAGTGFSAEDHGGATELEGYAAKLVNRDRQREGSAPIQVNSTLTKLARDYAQFMIDNKFFAHIDPQGRNPQMRAEEHGIHAGVYENLGYQTYGLGDERQMIDRIDAQMMSEKRGEKNHRYNITLDKHCCMGIGVASDRGRLIMVEEFSDSPP